MIPDLTNVPILIVEDDEASLVLFSEVLVPTKALIYKANDEESFNEKIKIKDIRIVLLDIKFGGLSGFDLLPRIRKMHPEAKIIAQTAFVFIDEMNVFQNGGFDGFLSKPIGTELLYQKICSLLGLKF